MYGIITTSSATSLVIRDDPLLAPRMIFKQHSVISIHSQQIDSRKNSVLLFDKLFPTSLLQIIEINLKSYMLKNTIILLIDIFKF